jgi:phospholipase C
MKKVLLFALTLSACTGTTAGNTDIACRAITPGIRTAAPGDAFTGTVFTIVMENKSRSDILGPGSSAPYIRALANAYAVADGYRDALIHPSEPNYLWMVAGENFGVLDDQNPAENHVANTSHLADQMEAAGITWRAYEESMGGPCGLESRYPYQPKHDPFVYFDDINGWDPATKQFTRPQRCLDHVVDYSQLDADLATGKTPRYVFITPNMQHDMHDGSIADGDKWLQQEVPKILASDAWKNGGVLFLTWDEGGNQTDDPPMIVISPLAKKGYVSEEPFDTSGYLKTVQAILGLDSLPCNVAPDQVATMDDLFAVPMPAPINPQTTAGP